MKQKVLPVILVHYNNFQDTADCVESILKSEGVYPYVIIVDNASSKGGDVKSLEKEHQVLVIRNTENIGFGRANNVGIQWAISNLEFDFLLLLNNDTLVEPDAFKLMIMGMSKYPTAGIATSRIMFERNRNLVWYGGGEMSMTKGWPSIQDVGKEPTLTGALRERRVSFISGCVMLFSSESIRKLNGFDDHFFMYCEDMELCVRAVKMGYTLHYFPESVIYHKVQGSFDRNENHGVGIDWRNPNLAFNFLHKKTNQWITMRIHLKGFAFFRFSLRFWFEFLAKVIQLRLKGRKEMFGIARQVIRNIFAFNG